MKRTLAVVVVAVLILGVATYLFAQRPMMGKGRDWMRMGGKMGIGNMERFADELELTQEQQDKMQDLRIQSEKDMIDLRAEKEHAQLGLRELFSDMDAKRSDIEKASTKLMDINRKIEKRQLKLMLDMRDVLTPEQREKARDIMKEHMKKGMGYRDNDKGEGMHHPPMRER